MSAPQPESSHVATTGGQDTSSRLQNFLLALFNLPRSSRTIAWSGFHNALCALHESSKAFPPLHSAIGALVLCLGAAKASPKSIKNKKECAKLALELKALTEILDRHLRASKSVRMSVCIENCAQSIEKQVKLITQKQERTPGRRLINADRDEAALVACYREIQVVFLQLKFDAELSNWNIAVEHLVETRLEGMNPSKFASYDSSLSSKIYRKTCAKDTRINVLSGLDAWAIDFEAPNVYWVNGMAGTGKTTIACTFAEVLKKRKLLGASFFCTRTTPKCSDVALIIPTIAYQLARYSTPFQQALYRILENDPDIASRTISIQFERLLIEPLVQVKAALPTGLVVVIDALDECSPSEEVELILDTLFQSASDLPLKFFLASRPEPEIRRKIQGQPQGTREVFVLHDVKPAEVQEDIKHYLQQELSSASSIDIQSLVKLSGNLFIYAATVVRYLQEGNLDERLQNVLVAGSESRMNRQYIEIDRLYQTIVLAAFNDKLEDVERERRRLMLWTAVCAFEPISIGTLSVLAGIIDTKKTQEALEPLQSVLYVSEDGKMVSTLHASFPEYLFDEQRSTTFSCDSTKHNGYLAERCFDLMKEHLRFNICKLESSHVPDKEVPDLEERVDRAVLPALAYACRYWGDHLQKAKGSEALYGLLSDFLSERLLFWMEVMNLKRWMGLGVRVILAAKVWLTTNQPPLKHLRMVEDALNFVTSFAANPISQSTPHLYISALSFCPQSSTVYKQYRKRTPGLLQPTGVGIERRDETILASWEVDSDVYSVAHSPDGTLVAVGCGDGSVIVKDAHDGTPVGARLKGHTDYVRSVAFSPNGGRIVSGSDDRTIRIWNVRGSTLVGVPISGHSGWVRSVSFSPDGTHIVSGSNDCSIRIWNVEDGQPIGTPLDGHTNYVISVAFSPDSKHIVSGSSDCTIRVWNVNDGTLIYAPLRGHSGDIRSVAFSRDGARIVSGSADRTVRVWNVGDGSLISVSAGGGHSSWINSVAFSPDGTRIVSASEDHTIRIWHTRGDALVGAHLGSHGSFVNSARFSPDGTRVVSGSSDRTVRVWKVRGNVPVSVPLEGHTNYVNSVAFSFDGINIASGSSDHSIRLWNVQDGTLVGVPLEGHTDNVKSISLSPSGAYIASGSADHTVRIWDLKHGVLVVILIGHTDWVRSVAFSPDSEIIVSGSEDHTIRLWRVQDGSPIGLPIEGHTNAVRSVAFSPLGEWIVSGSDDCTLRLWDAQTGAPVGAPIKGHARPVNSVAFSPDSARVISGSDDHTIRLWDRRDGAPIGMPFEGQNSPIRSVAFSPDGFLIVSGSDDGTVRVWNAKEGIPVGVPLEGHTSWVNSVAFSPDGTRIVSGAGDKTIRVWYTNSHLSALGSWEPAKDGWVRQGSRLIVWVPFDLAGFLPTQHNSCVIGPMGAIHVQYNHALIGENWDGDHNSQ